MKIFLRVINTVSINKIAIKSQRVQNLAPQFFLIAKMLQKVRRGESLAEDSQAPHLSTERFMGKGHPVTTSACSLKEKSKTGLMKPRRGAYPCD
jgi:hypothetical protein